MISDKALLFKQSRAKGGFHPLIGARSMRMIRSAGGDVVRRSLKCFAFFLSTFQRISFPHLPWDGMQEYAIMKDQ